MSSTYLSTNLSPFITWISISLYNLSPFITWISLHLSPCSPKYPLPLMDELASLHASADLVRRFLSIRAIEMDNTCSSPPLVPIKSLKLALSIFYLLPPEMDITLSPGASMLWAGVLPIPPPFFLLFSSLLFMSVSLSISATPLL
ncbi:hypothetical protein AMTRI_Chr02g217440 [Amborella trichopoda]